MKISEFLRTSGFYADFPLFQISYNIRLQEFLRTLPPEWGLFYTLCERDISGGGVDAWHPDRVEATAVKYAGTDDLDALQSWLVSAQAFGLESVLDALEPKLILDPEPTDITLSEILSFISARPLLSGCEVHPMDNTFLVPTRGQCYQILKDSPSHRFKYIRERRDCDKFTRIARSWAAEQGYGNLAMGGIIFKAYNDNTLVYTHSVLVFFYRNEGGEIEVTLGEPQTDDKMWNLDEIEPGHELRANRVEYTEIFL